MTFLLLNDLRISEARQTIKTTIPMTDKNLERIFFPGLRYIPNVLGRIKEIELAAVEPTIPKIYTIFNS